MITPLTPLPLPPTRQDPINFAARADAFLAALPDFQIELNTLASELDSIGINATQSEINAAQSATDAQDAAIAAGSFANYKGLWSSLTGALNKPASVKHNGKYWNLLNNLANVQSSEPGVSVDWEESDIVRVSGADFTGPVTVPSGATGNQVPRSSEVVHITGAETIAGVKTFSSSPIVPAGASGSQVPRASEVALLTGAAFTGPITVPVGAAGTQVPQAQETYGPKNGQLAGMRNKIINGKMEIAQRGMSFPAIASGAYLLDRWVIGANATAALLTASQFADGPPGEAFQNSLRLTVTTADATIAATDICTLNQRIEGHNVRDLVGKTFTLSFWVRSSKTGVHCVSLINSGVDRSYIAEYVINSANTWEYKSITVSGGLPFAGTWDWANGIGLNVRWTLAAGANTQTTAGTWQTSNFSSTANQVNCLDTVGNIFAITGVQLEVGAVATPFEHRPYGAELALCQRYCQLAIGGFTGAITSGSVYSGWIGLYPSMRTTPTVTVTSPWALNGFPALATPHSLNAVGVRTSQTANATITDGYAIHRIRAEAEL